MQVPVKLSDDCALGHRSHDVAFEEELLNRLDQIPLHITIVVRHASRHDQLGRPSTILVELDRVGLWYQRVCLAMNDQGRATHLFDQAMVFKALSDNHGRDRTQ